MIFGTHLYFSISQNKTFGGLFCPTHHHPQVKWINDKRSKVVANSEEGFYVTEFVLNQFDCKSICVFETGCFEDS